MTAPAEPTYGHKQVISAYRLKWIDLEEFLKQRFPEDKYPGVKFEEKKVNWLLNVRRGQRMHVADRLLPSCGILDHRRPIHCGFA